MDRFFVLRDKRVLEPIQTRGRPSPSSRQKGTLAWIIFTHTPHPLLAGQPHRRDAQPGRAQALDGCEPRSRHGASRRGQHGARDDNLQL